MGSKLKILTVTSNALRNNVGIGNTFINFFGGMSGVELANVYLGYGRPDEAIDVRSFQITDKGLVRHMLNNKRPSGAETAPEEAVSMSGREQKGFDAARKIRLRAFFWARELIWLIGRPFSKELKSFVDDFSPDVIFAQINDTAYQSRLIRRIAEYSGKPVCVFLGDDIYTLRRRELSPLFWIDRLMKRPVHRRVIEKSARIFVMTDKCKEEFDRVFKRDCVVLAKGLDFTSEPPAYGLKEGKPIEFVYTGNLFDGRWQTIASLAKALDALSSEGKQARLTVYSATPMSGGMRKAFSLPCVRYMGEVPSSEVPGIQREADVLVHAESSDKRKSGAVRLSFSTKLVDYMHAARCIFAIGSKELASIDHFARYDAAVIAEGEKDIYEKAKLILDSPELIAEYARKAWRCGEKAHQREEAQRLLYEELESAARGGVR